MTAEPLTLRFTCPADTTALWRASARYLAGSYVLRVLLATHHPVDGLEAVARRWKRERSSEASQQIGRRSELVSLGSGALSAGRVLLSPLWAWPAHVV